SIQFVCSARFGAARLGWPFFSPLSHSQPSPCHTGYRQLPISLHRVVGESEEWAQGHGLPSWPLPPQTHTHTHTHTHTQTQVKGEGARGTEDRTCCVCVCV